MKPTGQDSLKTRQILTVGDRSFTYFSIPEAEKTIGDVSRLPVSLKILLENVLRFEDGASYTVADAHKVAAWLKGGSSTAEVPFRPARILMQDFTGVPAVVDLAAHARRHPQAPRRPATRQPAGARRPGDRSLGHGRFLGHRGRAAEERLGGVRTQRRTLRLPALGPGGVPELQGWCHQGPASATR